MGCVFLKIAKYGEETQKRQKLRKGHGHKKEGSRITKRNRSRGEDRRRHHPKSGGAGKGQHVAARRWCCSFCVCMLRTAIPGSMIYLVCIVSHRYFIAGTIKNNWREETIVSKGLSHYRVTIRPITKPSMLFFFCRFDTRCRGTYGSCDSVRDLD